MPPRKRSAAASSSSSSRKLNQIQHHQPSKYGIQHFFERHTQTASQNQKIVSIFQPDNANPINGSTTNQNHKDSINSRPTDVFRPLPEVRKPKDVIDLEKTEDAIKDSNVESSRLQTSKTDEILDAENPSRGLHSLAGGACMSPQITVDEDLLPVVVNRDDCLSEISPEISKSASIKRLKFSPGMLIKQSQDDGGEEVTWRISPVNERLKVMSKQMPEMIRVLADTSMLNSSNFHHCLQNKISRCSTDKLEKWLSSPTVKAAERSLMLANMVGMKKTNSIQNSNRSGNQNDANNYGVGSEQSPFRTPPSLSYYHDKPMNGSCSETANSLGFRQHKKALIELLDQVEDALSVEELVTNDSKTCLLKGQHGNDDEMALGANIGVKSAPIFSTEKGGSFTSSFLVLEVSEKQSHGGLQCPFKVLRILDERSGKEWAVYLWDEWFYSVVAPGDTINVIGEFDDQGKCDVDRENNLLIVHPDTLVSGTRVASSFTCPRRTVLDERLKCNEYTTAALVGIMLHQVFQAALTREVPTKDFLEEYTRIVLQRSVESMYACGVNENDMHKTLIEAIPKILNWIRLYRNAQDLKAPIVYFGSNDGLQQVNITEVIDIEEMAWAPRYGLKGVFDASVRVKDKSSMNGDNEKIMPLEFKTGKATNGQSAMEHYAQVILYTLIMSERYLKHIDSGLLYYLHTDHTQKITVKRSDLIGLIMRRNELANDILKASTTQQLPPMLQSLTICKGCRHLNVCSIYHKAHGGKRENSGLGDLFDTQVHHLRKAHYIFLQHWDHLIDLEAKETRPVKNIRHSYGLESGSSGSTSYLSSIVLDSSQKFPSEQSYKDIRFVYHFVSKDLSDPDMNKRKEDDLGVHSSPTKEFVCTLKCGDYVMLSTETDRLQVASGVITDISRSHVSVSFSKPLRLHGRKLSSETQDILQEVWRIDKDEVTTSFAVMRFNLAQLFLQKKQSTHLRKIIIDLEVPRFDSGCISSQDPAISYICSEENLNNDQRRAILKILTAKDYALILGMPGTGKTSTLVHAVKALLIRGASILLTSYTNSAIDNLLMKLKAQNIDFLRIGRYEAVHEKVQDHCISASGMHSVEDIRMRLDEVKVVAVTCLGITSPLLANKIFDICIMDEAAQTTLPVSLGPLMFALKFVLVGDHYQLPPLVQSAEAREKGMGISLFCRLSEAHPQAISALQSQYRMCQGIMELSNALIYGNRLQCGSPEIANARLKYSSMRSVRPWLKEVLDPRRPVIFINTDMMPAFEAKDQKTLTNQIEALIIDEVLKGLISNGIEVEDVGIITPYNSQANLIRNVVRVLVEVHTIDKYQGRDKDCILVSFVRSSENPKNTASLLGDWHRINVALTRAKKKLVMVGSCRTISRVPLLRLLIEKVDEQSGILTVSNRDIHLIKAEGGLRRCSQFR